MILKYFRKARGQFDKYCAPLLHLAGLKVALVKTEHEGQAKDYMKVMENTSAVLVAGGDGTLSEVCFNFGLLFSTYLRIIVDHKNVIICYQSNFFRYLLRRS